MLKQRVITAIVLLALLLPALFHPDTTYWRLAALVLIAGAAWEWGRLNDPKQGRAGVLTWAGVLLCMSACVLSWAGSWLDATPFWIWALGGLLWVVAGTALLRTGVARWATLPRALRLVGGWAALWLTWLAVVRARELGIAFLLSVLLLVWVADIAAYFAGKAFGGRYTRNRLAPSISPNKSWEGAWGGLLGVFVLALIWLALERSGVLPGPSLYGVLGASSAGAVGLALALIFLTAMSVVGDLVESLVKRSAGMKDSSGLLPGHGGVLDRVDALLPTLPLALMLQSLAR
jgi:phosphatidate cytidylyltransferase